MVGLADIPSVGTVINRISEATVEAGYQGLRYCICSNNLVNDLNSEMEKVQIVEDAIAKIVAEAKNDGKIIEKHVVAWQEKVENMINQADEFSRETTSCACFKLLPFPNPVFRFQRGRKAAHLARTVTEHIDFGKDFLAYEIAHHPPSPNDYLPNSDTPYQSFGSRREAYRKLWEALVNGDGYPIIGIYGMPGVGKTRMVEEAWKDAMEKKMFDKVARVTVGGEKFDVKSLQDKLAVSLGCHLTSNEEKQRAVQLKNSLMNGGKTLVILDDIWNVIHLDNIGISFDDGSSKGCKILLTSRKQNVCLGNKCKDPIEIGILTDGEAWEMFRSTVGTPKIESLQDSSLAVKVCKKCGALPLLIQAVGKALKILTESSWKDALYQIENCKYEEIDGINSELYTCIQLSFEKLGEGEKTCLLLCSVLPEDGNIEIKMLFDLATGSELLDSRRDIGGIVDILKSSSLLLQGDNIDMVKVHDVIRDVARSIAARDPNYAFLSIRCRSRLPHNASYSTRRLLHLDLEGENVRFPDNLLCPELHTLWLQCNNHTQQLSRDFFNAFKNLKVLLLTELDFSEQELSIDTLEKLRLLILYYCEIGETFLKSIPQSLETLCIWWCKFPSPLYIPELKDLRKLELVKGREIEVVENVISSLSNLEELNIPGGFMIRDDADGTSKFAELRQLSCLKNLVILLDYSQSYPDKDIFSNFTEFNICVGSENLIKNKKWQTKKRCVRFVNTREESWWMAVLVKRAENVELENVKGLRNGFSDSNMREALAKVKKLQIAYCYDMEHVASWETKILPLPASFSNLNVLKITDCHGLKYLLSYTVAKSLQQIRKLKVIYCNDIQEIIRMDGSINPEEEIICFPKLEVLYLSNLQSLRSICSNSKVAFHFSSQLKILKVEFCDKLEVVIGVTMLYQFENLEQVYIEHCKSLKTVFQYSSLAKIREIDNGNIVFAALTDLYLKRLPDLESFCCYDREFLEVNPNQSRSYFTPKVTFPNIVSFQLLYLHNNLRQEIELGRNVDSPPKLTTLKVSRTNSLVLPSQWKLQLQNLENLELGNCQWPGQSLFTAPLTFKRLRTLEVDSCENSTLFTSSIFRSFQQLEYLKVFSCSLLKEIFEEDDDVRGDGINEKTPSSLLQLKLLILMFLPNLRNSGIFACYMPVLERVVISDCGLSSLFTCSAFRSFQQLKELEVIDCPLLEEIVKDDETPGTSDKMISLLLLEKIELVNLPRLAGFSSSSSFTFNMPAVEDISFTDCPCMDKFTPLQISTPLFGDLNIYVRQRSVQKKIEPLANTIDEAEGDEHTGEV